jgi:predicted metal-dependent phosphoesterase TrpH
MHYNIDLHTHSVASPDGGLSLKNYQSVLARGRLQVIAITDHNSIDFAVAAQSELGECIIVGEEIMTTEGEIIGLFLSQKVKKGLSLRKTVALIKEQQALVYVPHPFAILRSGIQPANLDKIIETVDIVEVYNGRAYWDDHALEALEMAQKHGLSIAASSDSHGYRGWGRTFSTVDEMPSRYNLRRLLINPTLSSSRVGLGGLLYPKINRIKKKLRYAQ